MLERKREKNSTIEMNDSRISSGDTLFCYKFIFQNKNKVKLQAKRIDHIIVKQVKKQKQL